MKRMRVKLLQLRHQIVSALTRNKIILIFAFLMSRVRMILLETFATDLIPEK